MHTANLVYSIPLLRRAVFNFWRRTIGLGFCAALILGAGLLAFLVSTGDRSWFVGAFGAILLLGFGVATAVFLVHYANALRKLKAMGPPEATFLAEDATFTLTSEIGTSTFKWSSIKELWKFEDHWLLLFSKAQFVTVPVSFLSAEMQAYVLKHVQSAGGKVI